MTNTHIQADVNTCFISAFFYQTLMLASVISLMTVKDGYLFIIVLTAPDGRLISNNKSFVKVF